MKDWANMEQEPAQPGSQLKPPGRLTWKGKLLLRALLIVVCGTAGWLIGSSQGGSNSTIGGGLVGLLFGLLFPVLWLSSCST
jgi:hypothetical protein